MTTENLIKELDAAIRGDDVASKLKEQYPATIETAKQVEAIKHRVETLEERVEQKRAAREAKRQALKEDLQRKVAALTANAGVANEEEKRRLKEAARDETDPDTIASYFDPSNDRGPTPDQ